MARIYLSSTYRDLESHRRAVFDQLTSMKHQVTAMEHYVARDDRPAAQCIADVQSSELYVGLFAWRYGYVPDRNNPLRRSVTELEYRAAVDAKAPTLVFLLDEAAAWPPGQMDAYTGDNEGGARIRALRQELCNEHVVSFFTSPSDLAARVGAAVHVAGTLAEVADAALDLTEIVGQDVVDRPEMLFSESYVPYLAERLAQAGNDRLLSIDLRDGNYWWSTRLFALATLAQEFTPVEWLLFIERGTEYVGMARPLEVRRALATAEPLLEQYYREVYAASPRSAAAGPSHLQAGQILMALMARFAMHPGGEETLRTLVSARWIRDFIPTLDNTKIESSGSMNPLGVYLLLDKTAPFVPLTDGNTLLKVIDRVGVATEIAQTLLKQRLTRSG
jgi:hypothetical protein